MPLIKLNGESLSLEKACSAEELLLGAGFDPASMIVVLNGEVVERESFAACILKDGDEMDLLRLAGGG